VLGGGATAIVATRIREKLKRIAAHNLEIETDQLEVGEGQVRVRGVPARGIPIATLARWALEDPRHLPAGEEPGLQETAFVDGVDRGAFSNSCHAAVVRVDHQLGTVEGLRYVVIEDCGRVINPMIVEGQVQGGTAQGIGGALLEQLVYDENGQLTTSTLADYLLPSTTDLPGNRGPPHRDALAPHAPWE
jgi:carbon-monoxide dehydrogenase large subunit